MTVYIVLYGAAHPDGIDSVHASEVLAQERINFLRDNGVNLSGGGFTVWASRVQQHKF